MRLSKGSRVSASARDRVAATGVSGVMLDSGIQRGVKALRTRLGAHRGTAAGQGDLDALAGLGLPTVGLVRELDIHPDDLRVVALAPGQLLGDVDPEVLGHFHIPALDDDVHVVLLIWPAGPNGPEPARAMLLVSGAPCSQARRPGAPGIPRTYLAPPSVQGRAPEWRSGVTRWWRFEGGSDPAALNARSVTPPDLPSAVR